jgi:hypothetical protein
MLEERPDQESRGVGGEEVPFRVVRSDGAEIELTYSSPRRAEGHDELAVLETLPWFEQGKPLRNWMLHETDFYDEAEYGNGVCGGLPGENQRQQQEQARGGGTGASSSTTTSSSLLA